MTEESLVPRMQEIYAGIDRAVAAELARLKDEQGIVSSCGAGCGHCCRHFVIITRPEAQMLARYVRTACDEKRRADLRMRTTGWHAWDTIARSNKDVVRSQYDSCCPFLLNDSCSVYDVRPAVCRAHHAVTDDTLACRPGHDPLKSRGTTRKLMSIMDVVKPYLEKINSIVAEQGGDPDRDMMLLPQALAVEMEWDCAIEKKKVDVETSNQ